MIPLDTKALADQTNPIEDLANKLRENAAPKESAFLVDKAQAETQFFSTPFAPEKRALEEERNEYFGDAYQQLNSGTFISKYDNYIPGTDNNERLALQQGTGEKLWNGVVKNLFGKVGTAVAGGTIGTVYGIGKAIQEGSFSTVYDNDFSRYLDDLNTRMDFSLANRVTKDEANKSLLGQMGTANFWANDFLGGLSFTLGAVVSEGIWAAATGGTSLAARAAMWSTKVNGLFNTAKALTKMKNWGKEPLKQAFSTLAVDTGQAITRGQIGAGANAIRFAVTSTGYEAGVEALHYKKEQEEMFLDNFRALNGRDPNQEEKAKFEEDVISGANGVFIANTAILIPSNIAMFGRDVMRGVASPFRGINREANRRLLGIGTQSAEGKLIKELVPTSFQKFNRGFVKFGGKAAITEGIYEEGGQGVASKFMGEWLESTYNPEFATTSFQAFDAMGTALQEQFGSKDGWKEIVIGMLIGGGSTLVQGSGLQQAIEKNNEYIDYVNTYANISIPQKFMLSSQIQSALKSARTAEEKNNLVMAHLASQTALVAQFDYKYSNGEKLSDLVAENRIVLDNMTVEQFEEFGVEENEIQEYKDTVLQAYDSLSKRYKQNRQYADLLIGTSKIKDMDTEMNAKALAYALTMGENSNLLMDDITQSLTEKLGTQVADILTAQRSLEQSDAQTRSEVASLVPQIKALELQERELFKLVTEIQNRPKTRGDIEGNEAQGNAYFNAAQKLLQVQEQKAEKEKQLDDISQRLQTQVEKGKAFQDVNLKENLVAPIITAEQLKNLDENLAKLDNAIKSYKGSNEVEYAELVELSNQYKQAKEMFDGYQNMAKGLSNRELEFKSTNTWIGKKLKKGANLNEVTQEFFADLAKTSTKLKAKNDAFLKTLVPEEEEVITVQSLTKKLKDLTPLTDEELEFYTANKAKIDALVNDPNKPQDTPPAPPKVVDNTAKIEALEKEKESLQSSLVINNINDFAKLTEEQRQELKLKVREQVEKLSDDLFFLTHLTQQNSSLESILVNGLNTGVAIESTTNVSPTKQDLIDSIEAVIDGKVDHVGSANLVVIGFSKSILPSQSAKKSEYVEAVSNYIAENHTEDFGKKIPPQYNVASFSNGLLNIGTQTTQSPNNQKRIEEIEKEIADLRAEEMGNLTEAQFLRQRLREALNNRFFPLIPTIEQGTEAIMPTQKEVSEYSDLLDKQDKTDEEQARFEELKSKLGMWRLMDSAYITDTQTVADIVELLNQLEAQIQQDEIVIDNLNDNSEIVQGSDTIYVAGLMQNTNGTPTAKAIKKQDGSIVLSLRHREVANIVNPLIQSGLTGKILTTTKVEVEATPKNIKKYAKKVGTIYEIGDIKITIGENGSLEMKESDFQKAKDTINTHVFDSAEISWSYADTFMEVGDNEFIKRPSDFSNPNLSSEGSSIQNLEEGDVVNLKVYTNSPYNQELRDRILKEVEDKGEVSQETLDLIEKNLEITADNHSVLKATADKMGTTLSDNNFLLLRSILAERFVQEVVEAGAVASVPKVIDVGIKASVKEVFLGTPNLMLERTPNGLKPKEIEFSDEALKQVVTQGYVQGNQTVLADKTLEDKVKRSYIKKLAEKNPTAKIPVVVFKVGKHFVAYPISLIKSPNPQGQSLDSILATAKNSTDAAKAINSMLISYGISPSEFNLIDLDKTKLDKIRERLDALTVFTSPDKMAESTYDKNLLKADAKIKVDLANKPISSPKLRIDLDTINLGEKKDLEMKQADLRASIVKDMVEIEKLIQGSVNLSIKNQFLTAFDDVTVRNTPQDIFNRKDVNLMKSIMYRPDGTRKPVQGDALKLLGQQRVDNLRRKLEQLQLLENQTKIKPSKKTEEELKDCNK